MNLQPMRFKTFTWPHNPTVYGISYQRQVAAHKVPFGTYLLQDLGRGHRVLSGEGAFVGAGAYDAFKRLANLFYEDTPGLLVHPLWQEAQAWFVELSLRQQPLEDYVAYTFSFWECSEGYTQGLQTVAEEAPEAEAAPAGRWHTVVWGDCLWNIAITYGTTVSAILALNPQLRNANLIYPGDVIRVA